jgi:hypothetical protein
MNLLCEYIRELLTESTKTVSDLGDMWIEIETDGWISVTLWKKDGLGKKTRAGEAQASKDEGNGPCSGAYEILWATSEGAPGFGPMLYDIVMELTGDAGLMSDRGSVSAEASKVWEYYLNSRPDVVAKQLDRDRGDRLTPKDESDDCYQGTFIQKTKLRLPHGEEPPPGYWDAFESHWSTKAYIKTGGSSIIDELEHAGKVVRK